MKSESSIIDEMERGNDASEEIEGEVEEEIDEGIEEDINEEEAPPSDELYWRCSRHSVQIKADRSNYLNFCRQHPKRLKCSVKLVDSIGTIVADNLRDATSKKIFESYTAEPTGTSGMPTRGTSKNLLEGYFQTEKLALDPAIKLYHTSAIQEGLVPSNTTLGDFIIGCIETLFLQAGYRIGLVRQDT